MVDKVALGKDFIRVLPFSPPVSFLHFSTLIFTYTLLLPEGKIGEFQKGEALSEIEGRIV
jgi:hypothetical protein